jgi:hypothetical protein
MLNMFSWSVDKDDHPVGRLDAVGNEIFPINITTRYEKLHNIFLIIYYDYHESSDYNVMNMAIAR